MEPLLLLAFAAILITCVLSRTFHVHCPVCRLGHVLRIWTSQGQECKADAFILQEWYCRSPDRADYLYAYRHAYRGMAFLRSYCLYCV